MRVTAEWDETGSIEGAEIVWRAYSAVEKVE